MRCRIAGLLLLLISAGWAGEISDISDTDSAKIVETPLPDTRANGNGMEWLDRSEDWVSETLHRQVVRLDSMFYGPDQVRSGDPRSRFRLRLFSKVNLEDPNDYTLDGNVSASIRLPGLEDRFRLLLDSEELGRFPDAGPEEQTERPQLTLRRVGRILDADVGAKVKRTPNAFFRLNFHRGWETGPIAWNFLQRGFYDTQEGFGELTSLTQHAWIGSHWMVGHASAFRWSESTRGVEWQDSITFYRVLSLIEHEKHGRFVGGRDVARGVGFRYALEGHHNGSGRMDSHKISLIYRRPLFRKDYLFLEILPEVEWKEEHDWDPVYTLRMGLDILFWQDR